MPEMYRWSSCNSISAWSRTYSVLNQQDINSDNESDEEIIKTTHEEGLSVGYKYFEFLKKTELYFWTGGNNCTKTQKEKKVINQISTNLSLIYQYLKFKFQLHL